MPSSGTSYYFHQSFKVGCQKVSENHALDWQIDPLQKHKLSALMTKSDSSSLPHSMSPDLARKHTVNECASEIVFSPEQELGDVVFEQVHLFSHMNLSQAHLVLFLQHFQMARQPTCTFVLQKPLLITNQATGLSAAVSIPPDAVNRI